MIKIGMIIGDRYEILEKIGTGGMSDVYKAKCHKLNRFVAVKVLKQEFSENANFVSKFRVEAQAAAGLMHPSIVNVYDVGEENGIYYIVMELVEGITLKNYIEKKARISVKEAISIAIQVSMGIEAAHNNHIIHRDIKPQNIIISKEGKVKVTDFGIAKAATSNTITSNVMGSVHYTSPEQARGGYSDERSDIYSLGITLFEMLTGRVPFNGETTVAIAIKHIQETLPSPREYVSEIPASVEQIVVKCCQKSPDRRYQSMVELVEDLKKSLMTPDEDFVKVVNPDEEAMTRKITERDMKEIKKQSKQHDTEVTLRLKKDAEKKSKPKNNDYDEDYDPEYDPKMERITTILTVIAAIIVGCIILFLVGKAVGVFTVGEEEQTESAESIQGESGAEMVSMPDIIGFKIDDAKLALDKVGLKAEIQYMNSNSYNADIVISAGVKTGESVETGSTINVVVSLGNNGVQVPDVTGKSYEEAENELKKAGFEVNRIEETSSAVEKGDVISQSPEADKIAVSGSSVTVRVSAGAESTKVKIPDLLGKEEDEAMAVLTEAGLAIGNVEYVYSDEYPVDQICYQSYTVGSYVDAGLMVDIKVSLGAQKTYYFSGTIPGPTLEEDPNFKSGTSVQVTMIAADGTILMDTGTTSFPFSVNYSGIKAPTGTLTFTYAVPQADGTTAMKSIAREMVFTEEQN